MSELDSSLADLAGRLGGLRAALVLETSGLEVSTWGELEGEVVAAELAELWRTVASAEAVGGGTPRSVEIGLDGEGTWIVIPLGGEYLLGLLAPAGLPRGKARFYAAEWARSHWEEFA